MHDDLHPVIVQKRQIGESCCLHCSKECYKLLPLHRQACLALRVQSVTYIYQAKVPDAMEQTVPGGHSPGAGGGAWHSACIVSTENIKQVCLLHSSKQGCGAAHFLQARMHGLAHTFCDLIY